MPTYEVDVQGSTYEVDAPDPNTAWRWANITYKKSLEQAASKEGSLGQIAQDRAADLVVGVGGLAQLPGQIYGLVTGDFGQLGIESAKELEKYGEGLQSEQLRANKKLSRLKIQEAEQKGGQLSAAGTAIKETLTSPQLLASFLTEQVPQLIPTILSGGITAALTVAGFTAKEIAKLVASGMAKEAAEIAAKQTAAKQAAILGSAAAKGTGAIQQGASVGAETYENAYKKLKENDVSDEEAAQRALSLARGAGASAAVISALAQNLPGAGAIEGYAAGVPGKFSGRLSNLAAGAAGESVGEALEEGGGKFAQNVAQREVDPNQNLYAGVGEAAGMAVVGGVGLGGAAGALRTRGEEKIDVDKVQRPPADTQPPPPPPPASPDQKAQERAERVEELANSLLIDGVSKEEAQERAEERIAKDEANDAQYEAEQQAAQQAKQQEVPSDVQQPNAESTGAGVPMVSEPSAGAPAPGVGGPESTGVVSAAAPTGQLDAGESQQRAPLENKENKGEIWQLKHDEIVAKIDELRTQPGETYTASVTLPSSGEKIDTQYTIVRGEDGYTVITSKDSEGNEQPRLVSPSRANALTDEQLVKALNDRNHSYESTVTKGDQVGIETPETQQAETQRQESPASTTELTDEEKQSLQGELEEEQNKPAAKPAISSLTEDQKRTVQAELDAEYNDAVLYKKSIAASIGRPDLAFHGFKTAAEAIQHVAKAGNTLQKLFAKRLASALEGVKFVVVEGENLPPELGIPANEWNGANGAFVRDEKGNAYIVVRGLDSSRNFLYQGVNNITVLHEALHAALQQKIDAGLKGIDAGLTKAVKALQKTMDLARERAQKQLDEDKLPLFLHDLLLDGKVFDDVHEFVSYAMTDPKFQKWLMDTPGHIVKTLYNQFVENVRQFFNMNANSVNALSDIINITDQLLSAKATENTKAQTGRVLKQVQGKLTEAFKKWFGNSKVVDENGDPLVVYRGVVGLEKNGIAESALNAEARKGYAAFGSSSPYVASSYANPEDEFGETGAVTPLYIKADKLIEFPVTVDKYGGRRFDYFEMDRRAQTLPAGTVLVARQVIDIGPRAKSSVDPEKLYSYYSDIYAWNNGTSVKSATGNNGEYDINNPSIKFSKAPKATKASATEEKLGKGNFADDLREMSTLTKLRDQTEFVNRAVSQFAYMGQNFIHQLLPTLQTSAVVEWAGRLGMSHIVEAHKFMVDMAGEKNKRLNQMLSKFDKLLYLKRKFPDQYKKLADIMHYTTLLSRDPTNAKALAGDKVLQRLWSGLDADTKKLYEEIRDHYIEQHTAYYDVLTKQIEESGLKEPEKSKIIAAIKQVYETGKTMYPYFPLMRYGQYWVRVGKGAGREFHMFENKGDRDTFIRERAKQLGTTWEKAASSGDMDAGNDLKSARTSDNMASTETLKTLFAAINNGAIPVTDNFGNVVSDKAVVDAETLKNQIYQMFLHTLPDRNFRKQFIMRKGIAGFSGDIARNFVTNGINMANQLTRIEYGGKAMKELELAKDALQGDPDTLKLKEFHAEMTERVTMQVRPEVEDDLLTKAVNLLNTSSYLWFMTSTKTAVAQLSSLPVFVGPVLTANHGFNPVKVAAALTKSLAVFTTNVKIKKNPDGTTAFEFPTMSMVGGAELTPDEKLAAKYMADRGITENTNTYELIGRRNISTAEAESTTAKIGNTVVSVMTALFHHTERMIREITFMTSYRLYRQDIGGINNAHEKALELAEKETTEALGAYSAYERPRGVLQFGQNKVLINAHQPAGKALLQFKMFAVFATTFFIRNAWRMFGGLDAKDKAQAMTKLVGSVSMSLALAGYVGVPGIAMAVGAVQGMMDSLAGALGDDDEEKILEQRDWELWFRRIWLRETFGDVIGGVLDRGVIAQTTGYDITSSLSFQNMWFPEVREQATAKATVLEYLASIAGPGFSLVVKTVPDALDFFDKGEIMRGMETLMPAFVKGAFTAERYEREGATTSNRLPIIEAKDFTQGQLFMQMLGFASTELVARREAINTFQGGKIAVTRKRNELIDKLSRAEESERSNDYNQVMKEIDKFNAQYPTNDISDETIMQSRQRREKALKYAQKGIPYDKNFEGQYDRIIEQMDKEFGKK